MKRKIFQIFAVFACLSLISLSACASRKAEGIPQVSKTIEKPARVQQVVKIKMQRLKIPKETGEVVYFKGISQACENQGEALLSAYINAMKQMSLRMGFNFFWVEEFNELIESDTTRGYSTPIGSKTKGESYSRIDILNKISDLEIIDSIISENSIFSGGREYGKTYHAECLCKISRNRFDELKKSNLKKAAQRKRSKEDIEFEQEMKGIQALVQDGDILPALQTLNEMIGQAKDTGFRKQFKQIEKKIASRIRISGETIHLKILEKNKKMISKILYSDISSDKDVPVPGIPVIFQPLKASQLQYKVMTDTKGMASLDLPPPKRKGCYQIYVRIDINALEKSLSEQVLRFFEAKKINLNIIVQ